ncbi:uncharacterized protein PAC_09288 [Phialocephala subalpina]|uniref:Uncharacterized protein n=1 Tax=Phialocephala subalpina TaxID=576137 RepID=A0A1L7X330_9HELO|nr:uncharacterized protein PAC_09288 [Phialocephala subalpina]
MSYYPPSSTRFPRSESFAPSSSSFTDSRDQDFSESSRDYESETSEFPGGVYHDRSHSVSFGPSTSSYTDSQGFGDDSRVRYESGLGSCSTFTSRPYQEFGSESSFQCHPRDAFPGGVKHGHSMSFGPPSSSFTDVNPPSTFTQILGDVSIPGDAFAWETNTTCESCIETLHNFDDYYKSRQLGPMTSIQYNHPCQSCLTNFLNFPCGPPPLAKNYDSQNIFDGFGSGRVSAASSIDSQPRTLADSRYPAFRVGRPLSLEEEGNFRRWSTNASKGSSQDRLNMSRPRTQPFSFGPSSAPSNSSLPSEATFGPQPPFQQATNVQQNCNPHWYVMGLPFCGYSSGIQKDYCSPCSRAFLDKRENVLETMSKDMKNLSLEEYLQKWLPQLARARPRFIGIGRGSHGWVMTAEDYMREYFGEIGDEDDNVTLLDRSSVTGDESTTMTGAGSTTQESRSETETETRSRGRSSASYSRQSATSSMPSGTTSGTQSSGGHAPSRHSGATSTTRSRTTSPHSAQQQSRTTSASGSRASSPLFDCRNFSRSRTQSEDRKTLSYNAYREKYRCYSPTPSEDRNNLTHNAYIAKWGDYACPTTVSSPPKSDRRKYTSDVSSTTGSVAQSTITASVTGTERSGATRSQRSGTSASGSVARSSQTGTESSRGRRRHRASSPASTQRSGATTASAAVTELLRDSSRSRSRSLRSLARLALLLKDESRSRSRSPRRSSITPSDHYRTGSPKLSYTSSICSSTKLQSPSPSNTVNSRGSSPRCSGQRSPRRSSISSQRSGSGVSRSPSPTKSANSNNSSDSFVPSRSVSPARSTNSSNRSVSPGSLSPQEKTAYYRALHPGNSDCGLEYAISLLSEDLECVHFGHHDQETGEWIECPFWDHEEGKFVIKNFKGKGKSEYRY